MEGSITPTGHIKEFLLESGTLPDVSEAQPVRREDPDHSGNYIRVINLQGIDDAGDLLQVGGKTGIGNGGQSQASMEDIPCGRSIERKSDLVVCESG